MPLSCPDWEKQLQQFFSLTEDHLWGWSARALDISYTHLW